MIAKAGGALPVTVQVVQELLNENQILLDGLQEVARIAGLNASVCSKCNDTWGLNEWADLQRSIMQTMKRANQEARGGL